MGWFDRFRRGYVKGEVPVVVRGGMRMRRTKSGDGWETIAAWHEDADGKRTYVGMSEFVAAILERRLSEEDNDAA